MEAFFASPYGIALILLLDFAALLFAVALTYRWLFKHIFDFLVSLVCILLTAPVWGIILILRAREKKSGKREMLFDRETYVGKKGKEIVLLAFDGSFVKYLPRLFDIFCGKLSFIGCPLFTAEDCQTWSETQLDCLLVRPGLITPDALLDEWEKEDGEARGLAYCKYAWNFGFFTDIKIFFFWLLKKIRGQ